MYTFLIQKLIGNHEKSWIKLIKNQVKIFIRDKRLVVVNNQKKYVIAFKCIKILDIIKACLQKHLKHNYKNNSSICQKHRFHFNIKHINLKIPGKQWIGSKINFFPPFNFQSSHFLDLRKTNFILSCIFKNSAAIISFEDVSITKM